MLFIAGTLGRGGAERQLYYQATTLVAAGAHPTVFAFTRGEAWEAPLVEAGVEVRSLPFEVGRRARLEELVGAARSLRPHVVQSAHFYTNLYAVAAARACRAPSIGAVRNDAVWSVRSMPRALGWLSLRAPGVVAVNSRRAFAQAEAFGVSTERLVLLPNAVDTDRFVPTDRNQVAGPVRLLTVARLEAAKRVDRLLRAVAQCRDVLGSGVVEATVVGSGSKRAELVALARALALDGTVRFVDAVDDVESRYRDADLFVLTSDVEGLPNVVLEAFAAGLPAVATDVGGVAEVVQPGVNGALVDADDDDALAAAILELVRDSERRRTWGRTARDLVLRERSLKAVPGQLAKMYARAMRER
ncbi:MAG: glycosyltransferase family 4 protein [Acidimicrobiales bacterium]|nr:glycosyltransferase family 4 protein [Acidimicrobiales bacterium]